jgi:hypothetical protein
MADGLELLGLGAAERAGYELLVDRPGATLAELEAGWTRPEPLPEILARLEDGSLATCAQGRYRAVAPAVAFEGLLAQYEELLEQARHHAGTLDAVYQARPTTREATTVVEVVTGRRAITQRLHRIGRAARERVGVLARPPHLVDAESVRPGVVRRTIYDRSGLEHLGALSAVERQIAAGQLARVLPDLPVSLYLADDRIGVLPLHQRSATDAVIVVHPSALLDALVKLFDGLWHRAMPLHAPPASADAQSQRLVTLLLSGLNDEAIAHQLGLSHRTVQRRVAALMAELGAHTRFQAGVQAALGRKRATGKSRRAAGSL